MSSFPSSSLRRDQNEDGNSGDVDPFDTLLDLEDQYHNEGYQLGLNDGARAGRAEGRNFGLAKGFEKFVEMGRLNGRARVWDAQLARSTSVDVEDNDGKVAPSENSSVNVAKYEERSTRAIHSGNGDDDGGVGAGDSNVQKRPSLAPIGDNVTGVGGRLRKHIQRLISLTDLDTLPTDNSEEGVSEFDDRVRDAKMKATLIERIIEEGSRDADGMDATDDPLKQSRGANGKGRGPVRVKRGENSSAASAGKGADVEDFVMPKHLKESLGSKLTEG